MKSLIKVREARCDNLTLSRLRLITLLKHTCVHLGSNLTYKTNLSGVTRLVINHGISPGICFQVTLRALASS